MDFIRAYLVMALLMSAYVAWVDPVPRMRGLAFDLALYTLMGLLWPLTWSAAVLIYLSQRR